MSDPLDVIGVLRTQLEGTLVVLRQAYGFHASEDLQSAYRSGRPTPRPSALTNQLETQIQRFETYLEETIEEVEEDDTT